VFGSSDQTSNRGNSSAFCHEKAQLAYEVVIITYVRTVARKLRLENYLVALMPVGEPFIITKPREVNIRHLRDLKSFFK